MLQGPSIVSRDCSDHICPIWVQLISPSEYHLHGKCINYHNRVVKVSASFIRTPRGSPVHKHKSTLTLSLHRSFCHSCLSLWQQTCYDGRVDDAEKMLGPLRTRYLLSLDICHRLASRVEEFIRHAIAWAPQAPGLPEPESFASSLT